MKIFDAPALILETLDLGERDRVVAFLTAEFGQKRGVARSARSKFSRFAGQIQPLAKVELTWAEKEGKDLVRLSEVHLIRPAAPLQQQLEGILVGAYLAETIKTFAQEGEPAAALFRLLDSTLEFLLERPDDPAARDLAARYVEIWVLRLSGLLPAPRECPLCGRPLADAAILVEEEAAIVCTECGADHHGLGLGRPELDVLRRSGRENLSQLVSAPPTPAALARVEALTTSVRRHFLQAELRSYEMMKKTLRELEQAERYRT